MISSNIQLQTMLIPKLGQLCGASNHLTLPPKRAHVSDSDVMHLNMNHISSMLSTNRSHIKSSSAQGSCSKYHQMLWELAHEETLPSSTCPSFYSRTPCPKLKRWNHDIWTHRATNCFPKQSDSGPPAPPTPSACMDELH